MPYKRRSSARYTFPGFFLLPYLAAGIGFAHFSNTGTNGASDTTYAADFGGGLDIKVVPFLAIRLEARDFYTPTPVLLPAPVLATPIVRPRAFRYLARTLRCALVAVALPVHESSVPHNAVGLHNVAARIAPSVPESCECEYRRDGNIAANPGITRIQQLPAEKSLWKGLSAAYPQGSRGSLSPSPSTLGNTEFQVIVERSPTDTQLIDILDRVLDKGIVIDAAIKVILAGLNLANIDAQIVVASVETSIQRAQPLAHHRLSTRSRNIPRLSRFPGTA